MTLCFCSVMLYLNGFESWRHFNWDTVYSVSKKKQSPEKTTFKPLKTTNRFSKVLQQHYAGEVGKSIIFVLYIIHIYSVPNNVEISQHM